MTEVHLELDVNIDHYRNWPLLEWGEVDAVLQQTSFSRLEEVTVLFSVENWQDQVRTMELLNYQLPLCEARGIVSFKYLQGRPRASYL
jgi:hypothetical protein